MFYQIVLIAHSWIRWLVLITLVFAIYRAFKGWIAAGEFRKVDGLSRTLASLAVRIETGVGILLYVVSPITRYFISNIREASGIPQVAMFGWMHPVGMIIAIALIETGGARSKKATEDYKKFARVDIFYVIALIIILLNIPWPFSPASRPLFRTY